MVKNNPIQYTGRVLDQRNTLTESNESEYPKKPKHVSIQQPTKVPGTGRFFLFHKIVSQ